MSTIETDVPVIFPVPLSNQNFKCLVDVFETQGAVVPPTVNYGQFDPEQHRGLVWDGINPVQWVHSMPSEGQFVLLEEVLVVNPTLFEDAIYADPGTTWRVGDRWVIKHEIPDGWALYLKGTGIACPMTLASSREFIRVESLNRWQPTVSSGPIFNLSRENISFPKASLRNYVQNWVDQLQFLSTCPGASAPETHKYVVYFDGSKWATKTLNGNQTYSEIIGVSFETAAEMTQAAAHVNMEFGYET